MLGCRSIADTTQPAVIYSWSKKTTFVFRMFQARDLDYVRARRSSISDCSTIQEEHVMISRTFSTPFFFSVHASVQRAIPLYRRRNSEHSVHSTTHFTSTANRLFFSRPYLASAHVTVFSHINPPNPMICNQPYSFVVGYYVEACSEQKGSIWSFPLHLSHSRNHSNHQHPTLYLIKKI